MTISRKLFLVVGVALGALILVAALLLRDIGQVYSAANYANENTVPSLRVLGEVAQRWSNMRIATWKHFQAHDPALMGALEGKFNDNAAKLDEALTAYAALVSDDTDKAYLEGEKSEFVHYKTIAQQALELSRAGKKTEAADLLTADESRITALLGKIDEHREYNEKLGRSGAENADHIRAAAVRNGVGATLLAILLSGILGFFTIRRLMLQLGGEPAAVTTLANRIATGDFANEISLRPGDTTSMLAAVSKMQDDLRERAKTAADHQGQISAIDKAQAVVEFDLDGSVRTANDNFLGLMGYRLEDVRGKNHSHFVEPGHRESSAFRQFWDQLRRGEHQSGLYKRIGQAGKEVWIQGTYNPIFDPEGKPYKVVKYANDVTEQVRMKRSLDDAVTETQAVVKAAIDGDLTRRIPTAGKTGQIEALSLSVNALVQSMAELIHTMNLAAGEVRTGAEEISRGNMDLSQRTEEQASSLEETASSMEEMTSTVKQTADNASLANQLAAAACQQAEKGGDVVGAAVRAMGQINTSSKKIADIIGVIDEIAFQTNLLALNAAVEAARAGEQGRGFAVVASEVRNLAGRSATAAKEIKSLIQDSVNRVEEGGKLVDESGRTLGEIVTSVKKVTDIVSEIASASREQSIGIEQVNKAVLAMDEVTQQNAALVEEASAASQALSEQSVKLTALIARYDVGQTAGARPPATAAVSGRRAA